MTHRVDDLDHFVAYRLRLRDYMNLVLAWQSLSDPQTKIPCMPSNVPPALFAPSVRLAAIGWFASLVDPTPDSVNFFVLARRFFPQLRTEIKAVEALVKPELEKVLEFRNAVAFHGNKDLERQKAARVAVMDKSVTNASLRVLELAEKLLDEEVKDHEVMARLVAEGFYPPTTGSPEVQ